MPMIDFSQEDLDKGKIITPGWYRVRVESVREALSKAGDSTNWILEGKIINNFENGSTEFANMPTPYWNFNSKAKGFMVGFIAALTGGPPEVGKRYELKNAEGKEVVVFIKNELYEGRMVNRLDHQYKSNEVIYG